MKFYTSAFVRGDKVYVRGVNSGQRFKEVVEYKPYLFINTKEEHNYQTVDGKTVGRIDFSSIKEAKKFTEKYDDVEGMPIYGMSNFLYPFLNDEYSGILEYDPTQITVGGIDIETAKKENGGFADPNVADAPILTITLRKNGHKDLLGYGDFNPHQPNLTYHKCENEEELLRKFLLLWQKYDLDAYTGWNVEWYDIPYIVNRLEIVLGEGASKQLSPWGIVRAYTIEFQGRERSSYDIYGISNLDYYALYQKFNLKPRESFTLDYICSEEIGEKKVDYSEYGTLHDLYEKNFQLFCEYNVRDVDLIFKLDDKLKMLDLVFTIAYDAKVLYNDALTSVRLWDVIIHNYLMTQNIVVNPMKSNIKDGQIAGGFVKSPKIGFSRWVMSFDLTSLYPHLIMQYGIGPDNYVKLMNFDIDDFFKICESGFLDTTDVRLWSSPTFSALIYAHQNGLALAGNGALYRKDKTGFLADLMSKMFKERKLYKDKMLDAEKEYQRTKDEVIRYVISKFNNLQQTRKVNLNSAYGALTNQYFRWFNMTNGESITLSGQLSIRWIELKLNQLINKLLGTTDKDYVVAVDTDSCYIELGDLVDRLMPGETDYKKITRNLEKIANEKIQPYINKCYVDLAEKMNVCENRMYMKLESIGTPAIWTGKKRYAMNVFSSEGVTYSEPKLKMMGIEAIRSSTPSAVRSNIKQAIKLIMETDEDTLQKFVADFEDTFRKSEFSQIAFPRGVKDLEYYSCPNNISIKGAPIQVKAALQYNFALKKRGLDNKYQIINSGDKIKFCYLKTPNEFGAPVLACGADVPKEFNIESKIDYDTQFEKSFLKPMSTITEAIGWQLVKKATLDDWFS